jgi:hypothetical protein
MSPTAREDFARRCGTTKGHIQNVMYGLRTCATDLAVNVERESAQQVRRWDLRSDWASHWPELIDDPTAPVTRGVSDER